MQPIIKTLILLFIAHQLGAQSDDNARHRHLLPSGKWGFEVGINSISALKILTKKSLDSANTNPYTLTMRLHKGAWGIRTGVGGSQQHSFNSVEGFADSDERNASQLEWRTGLDYRFRLNRKISATFGPDFLLSHNKVSRVTDSGFDVVETIDRRNLLGAGLSAGFTWWIAPRLSLYTEANFQWLTGERESARRFKKFPDLNDNLTSEDLSFTRKSILGGVFLVFHL